MLDQKFNQLFATFEKHMGGKPTIIARAPGRVNLIGEHTDYNDGFVFPIAIDRYIRVMARPRDDRQVKIYSLDFDSQSEFSLDNIQHDNENTWSNYPRGVAFHLQEEGYSLRGFDAVFTGDVPLEAGLSSSAAVEVAMAMTFEKASHLEID
ncbi:galactokinase, partial [Candidatus Poribacteria bacterium]|nr:galactokinase [Candidatus Poribacteria bacterium]